MTKDIAFFPFDVVSDLFPCHCNIPDSEPDSPYLLLHAPIPTKGSALLTNIKFPVPLIHFKFYALGVLKFMSPYGYNSLLNDIYVIGR